MVALDPDPAGLALIFFKKFLWEGGKKFISKILRVAYDGRCSLHGRWLFRTDFTRGFGLFSTGNEGLNTAFYTADGFRVIRLTE